jgi:hypothetical protein
MARMNAECGLWVVDLLEVQPQDRVLEVGFGPGVVIELLSNRAREWARWPGRVGRHAQLWGFEL